MQKPWDNVAANGGQHNLYAYQQAVEILYNHFLPKLNEPFEAQKFREMKIHTGETVDLFITSLKQRVFIVVSTIWT
jgi:hypothetical protein